MCTNKEYSDFVKNILEPKKKKTLSQATLETLTIIAYKQPVTKVEVEEKMTYVRNIMKENESVRFTSLIESNDKNEIIATFLSMLELIKTNEVFVVQDLFLGDILIKRNMEC